MVDRLVSAGLIDRRPHPRSRRELVAELTAHGEGVVREVMAQRRAEIAEIAARMPAERRGLVRALDAFTAAGGESASPVDV